ncbi:GNAT family N-acetyltransferase [Mesobacillus maritimus]|uniref:GNAT family N-acetyltransferase n=1 Tax=Mesobacillus maritimus TaxID=1643336 RepID=A0ABS7K8P9_9BACI|nr:GNAT family N-acetyltransferase [Mesobacillus maritimus]MBY0098450.1 GNAT family N-acetyltransferase [Mesobacillus maritimus]
MIIREIEIEDAKRFVTLINQVESESEFLLFESGERKLTVEQQEKRIEMMKHEGNSTIFVAEENSEFIGYLIVMGGQAIRNRHTAYLVIGIKGEYRGQGVGSKLFECLEKWAMEKQIHRLELTVVTLNVAGIRLYQKMGFEIEGTKRSSLCIDGAYVDEYYMSKVF